MLFADSSAADFARSAHCDGGRAREKPDAIFFELRHRRACARADSRTQHTQHNKTMVEREVAECVAEIVCQVVSAEAGEYPDSQLELVVCAVSDRLLQCARHGRSTDKNTARYWAAKVLW